MENIYSFYPHELKTADFHQYLLGAVSPRPICFASTLNSDGTPNLAPYSFFNCFSSKPPILVFSSNRRVRDNSTKDTLHNIESTREVVVNVVSYAFVYQMAVASIEYEQGISEFEKAGLTPLASDIVKPFRVKESPVQMECKVNDIIALGNEGGAGNLIICEIVRMHINEAVLNEQRRIDPQKIDLMARMGGNFYCRASGEAVFSLAQPVEAIGIGADQLPAAVRLSEVLSGNDIGKLAALTAFPAAADIAAAQLKTAAFTSIRQYHEAAKHLIAQGEAAQALAYLMAAHQA